MKNKTIIENPNATRKSRLAYLFRVQGEKELWTQSDFYINANLKRKWGVVECL